MEGGDFEIQRKLRPSPATAGALPMWLSRADDDFRIRPLPEYQAVYLQFNQVRDSDDESLAELAERFRETLKKSRLGC